MLLFQVHFVHRNIGNKTAVVGLLVEVQNGYNEAFIPIIQVLPEVKYKGESTYLQSRLTLSEMLPENPASFYRYIGSLTTPPCDEGVIWSILRKTTYVGRHQLDYFLRLYSVAKKDRSRWCLLAENYRPTFTPRKMSASQ
ncbi:unnamed protein product [Larinioides sclopetarius]|uniref:carbonic anhydrase n=1 Tax=Larinioides sclopetarius TaxID=280406 RepID=A0AAV2BLS8_9ARAC